MKVHWYSHKRRTSEENLCSSREREREKMGCGAKVCKMRVKWMIVGDKNQKDTFITNKKLEVWNEDLEVQGESPSKVTYREGPLEKR